MSAVMPGSSAPKGSSSSRIFGSQITAWAIDSRCCMPPDSCDGIAVARVRQPDRLEHRLGARAAPRAVARRTGVPAAANAAAPGPAPGCRSPSGAETANSAGTRCRGRDPVRCRMGSPSIRIWPRVGCSMPSSMLQEGGLAAARRADNGDELVVRHFQVQVLEHDLLAVVLPDIADRDRGHQRAGSAHAKALRAQPPQQPVRCNRQQGDPHDVGQDHVHRQVAPHQEDAVAQSLGGGDGLGGNQEQPRRTQRQPQRIDQPRPEPAAARRAVTSCQVEAPSVCALTSCSDGSSPTRSARSRAITGGDADHDQRDLGRSRRVPAR